MGLRWLVALAVVVVFVTGAHADEIGGARFTLPDGWTARDQNGSRVVVPSSLEQGELMKGIVLGVQPITGTPEAKLDEVAAILNGDATVTSTSAVTTTDCGAAGRVHAKNYVVDSKDDGAHNRMIAVLVRGKYCAVVAFLISGEPALKRHGDGLQTILEEPGDRRSTAGAGTDRTGGVAGAHQQSDPHGRHTEPVSRLVGLPAERAWSAGARSARGERTARGHLVVPAGSRHEDGGAARDLPARRYVRDEPAARRADAVRPRRPAQARRRRHVRCDRWPVQTDDRWAHAGE